MSMIQTAEYLKGFPPLSNNVLSGNADPFMYIFVYDSYYDWSEFQRKFPHSKIVGTAWLPKWTWHVNHKGEPNIRRAFMDCPESLDPAKAYVLPAPARQISIPRAPNLGVYGYVFQILSQADNQIQFLLGWGRIRMLQQLQVTIANRPRRIAAVPVVVYFDPRNTSDIRRGIVNSLKEKMKWHRGLMMLKLVGVPAWYIDKIHRKIRGFLSDVEPIFISPPHFELPRPIYRHIERAYIQVEELLSEGDTDELETLSAPTFVESETSWVPAYRTIPSAVSMVGAEAGGTIKAVQLRRTNNVARPLSIEDRAIEEVKRPRIGSFNTASGSYTPGNSINYTR